MDQMPPDLNAEMGGMAAPAKTVCITASPDGTYSVGDHDAYMAQQGGGEEMGGMETPEAPGMGAEMAEKPGMTPAATIDEALELARQMLQDDGRSAEEQMMAGYSKGASAMTKKPSPQQVFGE